MKVTIDLTPESLSMIPEHLSRPNLTCHSGVTANLVSAIRNQIASQLPTPKPAEPLGLGAVVEDDSGARWVRTYGATDSPGYKCWKRNEFTTRHPYSEVAAVRVLSEGVAS